MSNALSLVVPLILLGTAIYALSGKVDVFSALVEGAKGGLRTVANIFPSLLVLFPAIYMLRACGALDALANVLAPVFSRLGIPAECAPLMLLRPVSGSGALSVATEMIENHGVDSLVGRTAAVMMGATETTFYVMSVYFGAAGNKKCRHAIPAALCADLAGFLAAAWISKCFWA